MTLEFDFTLAMRQAQQLDELADELATLADGRFAGTMQQVAGNWKSDAAGRYLQKGATLQGNMGKTAQELKAAASNIRLAARRIQEAEEAARRLAEERKFN